MEHMRAKLIVAALVLIGAVAYLAVAGAKKGWVYYLDVDQYLQQKSYQTQRVRLCGRVAVDDLHVERQAFRASFVLLGPTQRIGVDYKGVVPDLFTSDADVVLEGKLGNDGRFKADVLMTKCASKYQAEEHAKRLEDPQ
ncbi:MAG: cytochrome c maturation protein CcmE [Phycisphaera sp.]|nr:cytochrome c maturation protein CcmE [Phycisphaera sp.]